MSVSECIFCKIIAKEIPSENLYEDEKVLVIKDIHPKAPVHLLILSKEHIPSIKEMQPQHEQLLTHLIMTAKEQAGNQNLNGYKLVFNVGREGGQIIGHLHLHLLGGWGQETHKVEV